MRKLAIRTSVIAFATMFGFAGGAGADPAGPHPHGIPAVAAIPFTAPFADDTGEVALSIGLIEQGGFFLVEIPLVAAGVYQVCLRFATGLGGTADTNALLDTVTVNAGDLALVSEGNLVDDGFVSGDRLYRPALRVYEEVGTPLGDDCVQEDTKLEIRF